MTFATTALAIAGIAGIAIPILIHLLARQRRKPIRWAAMRFLLEAYRKHRRRLQLEQWLLLAVRCLIIAILGLALARPLLQGSPIDFGGSRTVYLVIDDGLASGLELDDGRLALEHSVDRAAEIMDALESGDFVGVVTASQPARGLVTPPSSDRAAVLSFLRSLEPAQTRTDIDGALSVLGKALADADDAQSTLVYLLSEFRSGSAAYDEPLAPRLASLGDQVELYAPLPARDPVSNVQIVAIKPVRSLVMPGDNDGSTQIIVQLERSGDLDRLVSRVHLEGDGIVRMEPMTVTWERGRTEAEVEFLVDYVATGDRQITLTARVEADRLAADNRRYIVLESRSRIRAVLLDRRSFGFEPTIDQLTSGQWIRRALEPIEDGPIEVIQVEPAAVDPTDMRAADIVIVPQPDLLSDAAWVELRRFVDNAGFCIITPPTDVQVHRWVDRLSGELGLPWSVGLEAIDHGNGVFLAEDQSPGALLQMISGELADLAGPVVVRQTLPVDEAQTVGERPLRLEDGSTFLLVGGPSPADGEASHGLVALFTAAPDLGWTNLPTKPFMLPLFQELARQGLSVIRGSNVYAAGVDHRLVVSRAAAALLDEQGNTIAIDESARPESPVNRAGLWRVIDGAGLDLETIAVNVEPRWAQSETQSEVAVANWLARSGEWTLLPDNDFVAPLGTTAGGSPLARTLLGLLLVLVIVETIMARRFSHAEVGQRSLSLPEETLLRPGAAR